MPQHPSATHDGHRHVPVEHRPGYFECDRCGLRWIHRSVLPNGTTPTQDDIKWLHHGNWPRHETSELS
jgi:hypothetical protein